MEPLSASGRSQPQTNLRELLLTIAGTIVLMALAITFFIWLLRVHGDPIPESIRSKVSYPLYWASYTPPGFQPTTQGYILDGTNAVDLILQDSSHHKITIEQLDAPASFNPYLTYNQPLTTDDTSPLGIIYNLSTKTSAQYAVDSGRTIVLITSANVAVSPLTAKQIVDGLKPAH